MKKLLRSAKRLLGKIFGTATEELYWRFRHLGSPHWAETYVASASLEHPHRKFLLETIERQRPFASILEIGCASGPNLYLLAKRFPAAKLYGVDISQKAIAFGRNWLSNQGISNVFLETGKTGHLTQFASQSVDIVVSDAALVYVGPEKIEAALREMARVAKKAIILVEWHTDSDSSIFKDHWAHNYRNLFQKILPDSEPRFLKLSPEIWGGDWSEHGYIIEIRISSPGGSENIAE